MEENVMAKYMLGCGTWPYMFPPYSARPYTLEECLEMISNLKFDGVELSGFKPHAHPDIYKTKKDRSDLEARIKGYGLKISGIAADLSTYPIASPHKEVRKKHEEIFSTFIKFCNDLNIDAMRVDTVTGYQGPPDLKYEDAWKTVLATFKKYAGKAKDAGVKLVWEFEPGFMFNKPSEVLKLVKEVNHPSFTTMVDTCHAHCCGIGLNQGKERELFKGYPIEVIDVPLSKVAAEFIRRLKGYVGHVHIIDSDNTLNPHHTSTHVPMGKGVIDFDEVMRALSDVGYTGWLVLDLCFWPEAWNATKDCKTFMDSLVEKHR